MKRKVVILLFSALLLLVISVGGCDLSSKIDYLEFQATVTDMEVSTGGFGASSIVTISFDDGRVLPFFINEAGKFRVDHNYLIKCYRQVDCWRIKSIEEQE